MGEALIRKHVAVDKKTTITHQHRCRAEVFYTGDDRIFRSHCTNWRESNHRTYLKQFDILRILNMFMKMAWFTASDCMRWGVRTHKDQVYRARRAVFHKIQRIMLKSLVCEMLCGHCTSV